MWKDDAQQTPLIKVPPYEVAHYKVMFDTWNLK